MKTSAKTVSMLVLIVFISFISSGCATVQKLPIKLDPHFKERGIDTIVLMPVIDRRVDKKTKFDFEKDIRIPAQKALGKKGYTVIMANTFSEDASITPEQVAEMNVEELSILGPKDTRALLYIYVEDIMEEYIVLAYTFKIEATGSLIEKTEKLELWRDKGIGAYGQGGLISGVFSGMDKQVAISQCLDNMLVTLPKREGPPKQKEIAPVGTKSAPYDVKQVTPQTIKTGM